ncbi:MAG: phospho-N-acetylmuramoyl-pentapeptide-transferase [Clostridia bacterium]|nr:phospho-N-acetylmuramoyl-pentapeptide-transferase [Clostridia bacterium]
MKTYLSVALTAFGISFLFCVILIPVLKKVGAGQNILSYVKEHQSKSGTPTMGGLAFVLAATVSALLFFDKLTRPAAVTLAVGLAYMTVGFLDDILKKIRRQNLGLKAWQKLLFQAMVAAFSGIYALKSGFTSLHVPFFNVTVDLGNWAFLWTFFVFIATVNAVNLTDGLDGLAAGASIPLFFFLGALAVILSGNKELATVSFSLVGALGAYLLFNAPKASVFMGDTGSLSLGGFVASIASFTGNALYVAVIGVVFVFSVVSVIIQFVYFKSTGGKRVFLMSPAHHHFQQKGYSESKIAYAYFCVTLVVGALCVLFIL